MTSQNNPKDELDKLMSEVGGKAQRIVGLASNTKASAQYTVDLVNASRSVIKYASPNDASIDWEAAVDAWKRTNDKADLMLGQLTAMSISGYNSTSSGSAYAMTQFTAPQVIILNTPPLLRNDAHVAIQILNDVIDQSASKEKAIQLMREFGLMRVPTSEKSPIELFETAWAAYEQPVTQSSPISTSLIPMRECINQAIKELLRRRPNQEETKNQYVKIISIGKQIARDGIVDADVQAWASHWEALLDELSGSKHGDYSRDQWRNLLRRATLFLIEFLQGLDSAKLKP